MHEGLQLLKFYHKVIFHGQRRPPLGVAYERLVNRFEALALLRVNLLAVLRKS
jgi:hypothetical protein